MPRIPRSSIVVPGAALHVILRGNNRRRLFSYPRCFLRFLAVLRAASVRTKVPVHALSLMANHVHLVVTPPDVATLASFVRRVAQSYAVYRNRTRDGTGKVFEERYRAVPVRDVAQLAATLAYVDSNARFAGLERRRPYPWSTRALHFGEAAVPAIAAVWTPHDWYLSLGATPEARAARYAAFVAERDEARLRAEAACDAGDARRRTSLESGRRLLRPNGTRAA